VAGPDGFSRTVELEAVGTGAYAAEVPLDRPGAYVATALDETRGAAVAIAGAALSAGEELRPSGTDRALLGRIAELSGGKLRDTLAGIFNDRPGRRFAYESVGPLLGLLAAFGLLLMVTARRLALPAAITSLPDRWRARRSARRARAAARREARPPPNTPTLEALQQAKSQKREQPAPTPPPLPTGRPPPVAAAAAAPPQRVTPAFQPGPAPRESGPPSAPPSRPKSAAEILLARRKRRQR
jgi:hypothetical protein